MDVMCDFFKCEVVFFYCIDLIWFVVIGGVQCGEIDKLGDVVGYNGDGVMLFLNLGVFLVVFEYGLIMVDCFGVFEFGFGLMFEIFDQQVNL